MEAHVDVLPPPNPATQKKRIKCGEKLRGGGLRLVQSEGGPRKQMPCGSQMSGPVCQSLPALGRNEAHEQPLEPRPIQRTRRRHGSLCPYPVRGSWCHSGRRYQGTTST